MRTLPFHQLDVFTDRPFSGNPLAVFPEAEGLTAVEMQAIASEMNLSETTFILPPEGAGDARVADFCAREGISVLLEIPQERRIAEAYARGLPVVTAAPELRPAFCSLLDGLDRLRTPAVARAHMGS